MVDRDRLVDLGRFQVDPPFVRTNYYTFSRHSYMYIISD